MADEEQTPDIGQMAQERIEELDREMRLLLNRREELAVAKQQVEQQIGHIEVQRRGWRAALKKHASTMAALVGAAKEAGAGKRSPGKPADATAVTPPAAQASNEQPPAKVEDVVAAVESTPVEKKVPKTK